MLQLQHVSIAHSDFCAAKWGLLIYRRSRGEIFAPEGRVTKLLARSLGNDKRGIERPRTPKGHQDPARGFNPWSRPGTPYGHRTVVCLETAVKIGVPAAKI